MGGRRRRQFHRDVQSQGERALPIPPKAERASFSTLLARWAEFLARLRQQTPDGLTFRRELQQSFLLSKRHHKVRGWDRPC